MNICDHVTDANTQFLTSEGSYELFSNYVS